MASGSGGMWSTAWPGRGRLTGAGGEQDDALRVGEGKK